MRYYRKAYKEIDSTNSKAHLLARNGAREGTVIIADYQTKGKGRYQRKWISPRGENLLFSIILRPKKVPNQVPFLTHITARAVKESIETLTNLPCTLKRPNDVLIGGKKVCGILTESKSRDRILEYVVVGVGINVNSEARSLVEDATSLYEELHRKRSRKRIFETFLRNFRTNYVIFNEKR